MSEKYADRRIIRTRKFLRKALIELLKEKPIGKITPTELCKIADINRNTFYSHYSSPEDLLHSLENELLSIIKKAVLECPDAVDATIAVCQAMRMHKDLCSVLLTRNADPEFNKKVFSLANKRNLDKLENEKNILDDQYRQMMSAFMVSGGSSIIQIWVESGMKEDPEKLARFIKNVSLYGTTFTINK